MLTRKSVLFTSAGLAAISMVLTVFTIDKGLSYYFVFPCMAIIFFVAAIIADSNNLKFTRDTTDQKFREICAELYSGVPVKTRLFSLIVYASLFMGISIFVDAISYLWPGAGLNVSPFVSACVALSPVLDMFCFASSTQRVMRWGFYIGAVLLLTWILETFVSVPSSDSSEGLLSVLIFIGTYLVSAYIAQRLTKVQPCLLLAIVTRPHNE